MSSTWAAKLAPDRTSCARAWTETLVIIVLLSLRQAQRAALEREATKVAAKSAGSAQMVCPWSGVIINVDEARQRDHKSGRNYQ